jgi:hypothetical protein
VNEVAGDRLAVERLLLAAARIRDCIAGRPVEMGAVALSQVRVIGLRIGAVDLRVLPELVIEPDAIEPAVVDVRNRLIVVVAAGCRGRVRVRLRPDLGQRGRTRIQELRRNLLAYIAAGAAVRSERG